jgi:hypothetical protein
VLLLLTGFILFFSNIIILDRQLRAEERLVVFISAMKFLWMSLIL